MRGRRDWDDSRASLPGANVVENREHARRLDDSTEAAKKIAEVWQRSTDAALTLVAILGTVGPIDPAARSTQIYRGRLVSSRRHGSVLAAGAARVFVPASCGWRKSASWNSRRASRVFWASDVSRGILPSGGSTMSEVRRPTGKCTV